ncbi:MAG: YbaN family protein [Thermoanaerobaculia bacterium]|nr:YbaN family protein [Thermoanaerobaculia bacterium]
MKRIWKFGLLAAGFVSLGLGILGALLPLLPTTVFLLIAAYCFARSSDRFYAMLLGHRWSGPYIRNYRDGRPMTSTQLASTLGALWLSITASALLVRSIWIGLVLLGIATGVTTYLVMRNNRLGKIRSSATTTGRQRSA